MYFLHGYHPGYPDSFDPIGRKEYVLCCQVDTWELERVLPGQPWPEGTPCALVTTSSYNANATERYDKPVKARLGLEDGARYFVVKNDGSCQIPNGEIVWQWPAKEEQKT